jgi:hypothetical protein
MAFDPQLYLMDDGYKAIGRPLFVGTEVIKEYCTVCDVCFADDGACVISYERDGWPGHFVVTMETIQLEDGVCVMDAHGDHIMPQLQPLDILRVESF